MRVNEYPASCIMTSDKEVKLTKALTKPTLIIMKYFNTAGPVNQDDHYKIDPLHRWDLDEILMLIEQKKYFILHAPRQTGKTSSMLALMDYVNADSDYRAIYLNVEIAQAARNDIDEGIGSIINKLSEKVGNKEQRDRLMEIVDEYKGNSALGTAFTYLCESSEKPVILLIDEIDSLVGDTLISVLRQIREGYYSRPDHFPISLILCGIRDIKDYRIWRSGADVITGGSAFNIKAKSLRLGNFSEQDVKDLLTEHTKETGQIFADGVAEYIFAETDGQPWLVNAIAYEITFEMKENRDPSVVLTQEIAETARERVILSRTTHLDQLADKLREDRIRRVILPMLQNTEAKTNSDDEQYCIDQGLIKNTPRGLVIANNIYREIIPRELTDTRQNDFLMRFAPDWVNDEGLIDSGVLLGMFTQFWRENSDIWGTHIAGYEEAAPHLVFQAYLQRVANGQGLIYREYGLGRGRTDLMLKWRNGKKPGEPDFKEQRIVIELKIYTKKNSLETLKKQALEQTLEYAKKSGSTENHILIFDRDERTDWRKKLYTEVCDFEGEIFKIWGV